MVDLISYWLFFLPFGLIILWVKNKGKKNFKVLINEYEHYEIKGEAVGFFLNLIAAIGAAFMFLIVIYLILTIVWKGIQKIF